jgi:hypothetical protein
MRRISALVANASILVAALMLAACGGGGGSSGPGATGPTGNSPPTPPATTYTAGSGVAQKGPLAQGATVTVQELDAGLNASGSHYTYTVTSNLGTFSPTAQFASRYLELTASGNYFDEAQNAVSSGPVTLTGYSDLGAETVLNVNLLTTLARQRIQHLVSASGMSFAAARTQAEREVLVALNIPSGTVGAFDTLDLSGSHVGDHILAAVSSLFVYGNAPESLNQLITDVAGDIAANGTITNAATRNQLVAAAKGLNPATVAANLTQLYSSAGVTFAATDISNWIDQEGDGVIGAYRLRVPDATIPAQFVLPGFVVAAMVGGIPSVSKGSIWVNGQSSPWLPTALTDTIGVAPADQDLLSNGMATVYVMTGSTRVAAVTFISGLSSISITPASVSVPLGISVPFKVAGVFNDALHSTADLTSYVAWTSSNPSVVTAAPISAKSHAVGTAVITATLGSLSASATEEVTPVALEALQITPNPAYSGVGIARPLTATALYSDGSRVDVTNAATWTSDTASVAVVGPTTGRVTGVTLGSANISATFSSATQAVPLSVVTNTWHSTNALQIFHGGDTATLLQSGQLLLAGGSCFGTATVDPRSELYDPVADRSVLTGSMSGMGCKHSATLLSSGKVLAAGGYTANNDGSVFTSEAQVYDPAVGTWSNTGSLSIARVYHTATLLPNGKVLVAGGMTNGSDPNGVPQASAEIYDPALGTWSPTGSLSVPRYNHTATLLSNGLVLVTGGSSSSAAPGSATAELYDPAAGTWSPAASMSIARESHTATLLQNGTVLVAGGLNSATNAIATVEIYDPTAVGWSSTGSLSTGRQGHTAAMLPNGKVLVAGGCGPGPCFQPPAGKGFYTGLFLGAELYDPVAGAWSSAGTLSAGHTNHTETVLPNGIVMVVGLEEFVNGPDAELYW